MSRSAWKTKYIIDLFQDKQKKTNNKQDSFLRNKTIAVSDIGNTYLVYNGCKSFSITVTPIHVGYKFGSFSFTRTKVTHKKKKRKKK